MYGRCETDPFDQATDVCDSCYGEFCSGCMVKPKRRKHAICRECAIIASGVRPGAKPLLRGSKKTAAKRRKALKEAPSAPRTFEYFDDRERQEEPAGEVEQTDTELLPLAANTDVEPEADPKAEAERDIDVDVAAGGGAEVASQAAERAPAEPAAVGQPEAEPAVTRITPGLAALAKHQADRRAPTVAPESVPAPDWLTESVTEAVPPTPAAPVGGCTTPAPARTQPSVEDEPVVYAEVGEAPRPVERRLGDDKPVTNGYDWVTEMPPRGASNPLPSRSRTGNAPDREPAPPGGLATADRPKPALPKRRSKLRPTVDS